LDALQGGDVNPTWHSGFGWIGHGWKEIHGKRTGYIEDSRQCEYDGLTSGEMVLPEHIVCNGQNEQVLAINLSWVGNGHRDHTNRWISPVAWGKEV
jgi:hypothetical protein